MEFPTRVQDRSWAKLSSRKKKSKLQWTSIKLTGCALVSYERQRANSTFVFISLFDDWYIDRNNNKVVSCARCVRFRNVFQFQSRFDLGKRSNKLWSFKRRRLCSSRTCQSRAFIQIFFLTRTSTCCLLDRFIDFYFIATCNFVTSVMIIRAWVQRNHCLAYIVLMTYAEQWAQYSLWL